MRLIGQHIGQLLPEQQNQPALYKNKFNMTWKKTLKRMKLDDLKAKAPGFFEASGGYEMKVKPYSDKAPDQLIKAIIDFITFSGGTAKKYGIKLPARTAKADIIAVFRSLAIEIVISTKQENGSDNFKVTEMAGGFHLVISSFPSFLKWWQMNFDVKKQGYSAIVPNENIIELSDNHT